MVFARERSSEMPCTPNEGGTLMNRVHVSIVALLVALGSPMAWSASAAPPSHTGAATTSAPDAAPVNINSADVKELMKLEGVNRRVAEKRAHIRTCVGVGVWGVGVPSQGGSRSRGWDGWALRPPPSPRVPFSRAGGGGARAKACRAPPPRGLFFLRGGRPPPPPPPPLY